MPPVLIANTIRVTFRYDNGARNVIHVKSEFGVSPYTLVEVTDAANEAEAAWATNIMPVISSEVTLDEVEAVDIGVVAGTQVVVGSSTPGGTAGGSLPDNVSLVISWATAVSGRNFRGRTFLPGIPVTALDTDNKQVTVAYRNTVDVAGADLKTELLLGEFELQVGSPTLGTSQLVTSSNVNRRLDTQRRRLNNA